WPLGTGQETGSNATGRPLIRTRMTGPAPRAAAATTPPAPTCEQAPGRRRNSSAAAPLAIRMATEANNNSIGSRFPFFETHPLRRLTGVERRRCRQDRLWLTLPDHGAAKRFVAQRARQPRQQL